ncbi:hypothetical protein FSARC_3042 [Fusarium sarcochroum]|uniref:Tryptophan synthase beta chain-like PALP domain-containing protein n=1 Tax=Fusarium sarcochroum TaxID=1208366 RepID=A0A8H4U4Y8_9HYPO|nr:hypothetical protein FSARC_3042 [Fusarium sarcochroum]
MQGENQPRKSRTRVDHGKLGQIGTIVAYGLREQNQGYVFRTPCIPAKKAGQKHSAKVYFKLENYQLSGSYAFRGAMARMSFQSPEFPLITASSGNHGIAAALASHALGRDLTIVMPKTVEPYKLEKVKAYAVKIILYGSDLNEARECAERLGSSGKYKYFSPYNDSLVIAGYGTVWIEIYQQCKDVKNIFVPMGGGALISGIGCVIEEVKPKPRVWGISAVNSMAMAASLATGFMVETEHLPTLAESVAGDVTRNSLAFALAGLVVDDIVTCNEDEIRAALKQLAFEEGMHVEGSAALALAGFNKVAHKVWGQRSAIVLTGANFDWETLGNVIYDD